MKRLLIALALLLLLLLLPSAAHAQSTKAALTTEINTNFATGVPGGVTAATMRTTQLDILNSIMPTAPVVNNNLVCFDGITGLLKDCGAVPNLVLGTTTITGGTTTRVLFDNAGILGEYVVSGTGNVAMTTSPVFTTPAIGVATGASLALTSSSADCLDAGLNGVTNPVFKVDCSTGSQVAGLKITGAVTGGTVSLAAIDSGSNTPLQIKSKGTGAITIQADAGSATLVNFGVAGSTSATITLAGASSGALTVSPPAVASGTITFPVPAGNAIVTQTIASGAKALATGAIGSAACTSAQTDTATGAVTTDVVTASFNGDPTAVTGYVPLTSGMLTIIVYPTANLVNFKVCNNTAASITPGAITLNWRVVR